ncbi:MAG: DUF2922 domain-containing protein [Alicyclobacillaceae bacterium]|jgi:hypothetical protein|uniref:DUF2922 domain-containing protein n=1 Tax=Alicyclobacillus sp. SP_1 TaxID=2942475 RepID=UPI002158658A|nr:DUF2922 domain-containing protein [Alicyclobacillus sp. SP_1]MCY0887955.1 DUF2922 domain-containing protein [Alicyclobacillaceae bacterium]
MATKVVLQLQFLTDANKKVRISVPTPVQPVDNTAVDKAMDLIVEKQLFAFAQGMIVKKIGAEQVETTSGSVG